MRRSYAAGRAHVPGTKFRLAYATLLSVRGRTGREPPAHLRLVDRDNRQTSGRLIRFLPEQGTLGFVASGSTSIKTLQIDRIKKVQLLRPVQLLPRELERMQEAGVAPPIGNQSVRVSFKDGEKLAGETSGFLTELTGLYLYLAVEEGKVQRAFIPAHAYADYSIGPSLGEMLSEQQQDTVDFVQVGLHL